MTQQSNIQILTRKRKWNVKCMYMQLQCMWNINHTCMKHVWSMNTHTQTHNGEMAKECRPLVLADYEYDTQKMSKMATPTVYKNLLHMCNKWPLSINPSAYASHINKQITPITAFPTLFFLLLPLTSSHFQWWQHLITPQPKAVMFISQIIHTALTVISYLKCIPVIIQKINPLFLINHQLPIANLKLVPFPQLDIRSEPSSTNWHSNPKPP